MTAFLSQMTPQHVLLHSHIEKNRQDSRPAGNSGYIDTLKNKLLPARH